jgi:hypothetical protein
LFDCCAPAPADRRIDAPAINVRNSRRLMGILPVAMSNIAARSCDHFIGLHEQRRRYFDSEFLDGLQVETNFVLGWLRDWNVTASRELAPAAYTEGASLRCSATRQRVRPSLGKLVQAPPASSYLVSRGLFCQQACKGLFSLFGCLRHAFKKAGRAFYQPRTTGAIDFPPPGLRSTSSSLHDERIVGRVKSFTHAS